jgi:excisionase family DNA binding protein
MEQLSPSHRETYWMRTEVANILRVKPRTVDRLRERGELKFVRLSAGRLALPNSELERYLNSRPIG